MLDKRHKKLLRYLKSSDHIEVKKIMPQPFRKRRWLKWGCPVVGGFLMLLVVAWPRVITEQLHHGSILNQILGLTYRGKQANGDAFVLKSTSAHEIDSNHIAFSKPSIEASNVKMKATSATLDVPKMRIDCEGPVELRHQQVVISTRKAQLHMGKINPGVGLVPAAGEHPRA